MIDSHQSRYLLALYCAVVIWSVAGRLGKCQRKAYIGSIFAANNKMQG